MINNPYIQIEIGNIINNNHHYIKKGTIVEKENVFNQENTPITYYDDGVHRSTDWTIITETPSFDYDGATGMWTLDGLQKNECYFCEIPVDVLNWHQHINDISIEITLKIDENETLYKDGTTNDMAGFFNWKNLYIDSKGTDPEWPECQEFFKINRKDNTYMFGRDIFDKTEIKLNHSNKLYWRYEIEPYKDFYDNQGDYDGDFLYPLENDVRICRGWNTESNKTGLEFVKRYIPSLQTNEKYKRHWNLKNCDRIYSKDGDKIRFKFFYDKNGNVFKKYSFKDFKIKINIPYYCYHKNILTMYSPSISKTNNFFRQWSSINYEYSMFTRKTEKIGNQSIQNSGTKITNRLSNMQRLWIALSGGKNLKDNNGNDFYLTSDDNKFGRDKLINILSPLQQLLWVSWHLENESGTWKKYIQNNYQNGNLNTQHINIFLTRVIWLWQTIFDIMPTSKNNLNTDEPPSDLLGGQNHNFKTYYNKNYYFKIIKELIGWPMPIAESLSTILYNWLPPKYTFKLNSVENKEDIYSTFIDSNNSAEKIVDRLKDMNFFYTIPSFETLLPNRFIGYTGDNYNNHAVNLITTDNFVNNINYEKINNGWFSPDGYLKKNQIPILTKTADDKYMYRISDTAKRNNIRGIYTNSTNTIVEGTKQTHGGLIIRLPENVSKYSLPWNNGEKYIPKITNIRIEIEFAIRQLDENNKINSYPISNIFSTHHEKSLVYFKSKSKKVVKKGSLDNAWKHGGMWNAAPEIIDYNVVNFFNVSDKNEIDIVEENAQILDNGVYKVIYNIDNLPLVKKGDTYAIEPSKSAVLMQVDYAKTNQQKELGIQTLRMPGGTDYNGENGKPNYSISPDIVGNTFKNDGEFSFSVHKENLYGLESDENTKKHLGFYLFAGEHSQSSYYFKNIKVELNIPQLELENAILNAGGETTDIKINKLLTAIQKAENIYDGVIDKNIITQAKNKVSFMKINKSINLTDIETNDINLSNIKNLLDDLNKLTLETNSKEFDRKIELENIYNYMNTHNVFIKFDQTTKNIKTLNDMITFINTKNIDEKYKEKGNILIRKKSLSDTLDLTDDIQNLSTKINNIIEIEMKELNPLELNMKNYKIGDGLLSKYILLVDRLAKEGFNNNIYSKVAISTYNKTPFQMLNEANIYLNSIVSNEVALLNELVANSNKKENIYKLIEYLLKISKENQNGFLKKTNTLNDIFLFGERHVNNIVNTLITSWNDILNDSNWSAKEYGFNWLSDKTANIDQKNSFSIDLFHIDTIQQYIDIIFKNLNLKVKDVYSLSLNIYNKNKGRINKDTVFDYPIDPYLFVEGSILTLRCKWQENKYTKPFFDTVWYGKRDPNIVKNTNKLGQMQPWNTPLGALSKRLIDNSESFLKLSVATKSGFPNIDRWYYPGIVSIPINFYKEGTISYPDRNWEKYNSILKKPTDIKNSITLPPGPFTKLVDFMENTIKTTTTHFSYRIKKNDFYDKSIWLYEYGLKFDTNNNKSIYYWINISEQHGLDKNNPQLLLIKNKLKNKNKDTIIELKNLYEIAFTEFRNNDYNSMNSIRTKLADVSNNNLQTDIIEYKNLYDLLKEEEIILRNRLILFAENAIDYSFYNILNDIIEQAKTAGFHRITDNIETKNAYNKAIKKLEELGEQNRLYLIQVENIKKEKEKQIQEKIKEIMEKNKDDKIQPVRPTETVVEQPTETVVEQPTETVVEQPTETVVEQQRISSPILKTSDNFYKKYINISSQHNRPMFNIRNNSTEYLQSNMEANTGSMSRLHRLKKKNTLYKK